jgi:hypothetical protein
MTLAQATDVDGQPAPDVVPVRGRRYRTLVDLAALVAVALALRLPAVGFGLPTMLHPDEPANIATGARMAANGDWNPHGFAYPSLMYDVEAIVDLGARLFTGHMLLPSSFVSQDMGIDWTANPNIVLFLRLITVALSVGICLVAYGVVRRITGRRWAAVGAGLLAATSPLLVTNGVYVTPDTYSAFFAATAVAASLAVLRRGTRRDYVLAGLAVGFTAGSKYDIIAALPVVVAYALREGRDSWRLRRMVPLGWGALAAVVGFAVTTPAAVFDTSAVVTGLNGELTHYATGHAGAQGGAFDYYLSLLVHDQPVLLPGLAVALLAAWRGRFRKEIIVVAAFAVANFALISTETVRFDRDLLPVLPALMMLNGFAAVWVAELAVARWPGIPRTGRLALTSVAVVGVLIPALIGALGVPEAVDQAPRTETMAWLEAHVPKGSFVVNENYGPWITSGWYRVADVSYVLAVTLPAGPQAIIVTDEGSGRFLDQAGYASEVADYKTLLTTYCVAAKFTNGPWIEVLTPCS